MSSRERKGFEVPWCRAVLWTVLVAGVVVMLWPVGQVALSWNDQRALRQEWEAQIRAARAESPPGQSFGRESSPKQSRPDARLALPDVSAPTRRHRLSQSAVQRNLRQAQAKAPKAQPRPQRWQPTRIVIPSIEVDAIVVRGVDTRSLKRGPGHDPTSSLPGQRGNCVIAAHRNAYGWWFYRLNTLGSGSVIELHTPRETLIYEVAWTRVVPDTATWLLRPPPQEAAPRLTLYTCALPHGSKRIVVGANLVRRVAA